MEHRSKTTSLVHLRDTDGAVVVERNVTGPGDQHTLSRPVRNRPAAPDYPINTRSSLYVHAYVINISSSNNSLVFSKFIL